MHINWDNKHKIVVTEFGETRLCDCVLYNMSPSERPDEVFWVERNEDYYGLPHYKDSKLAILHREDWLNGKRFEQ